MKDLTIRIIAGLILCGGLVTQPALSQTGDSLLDRQFEIDMKILQGEKITPDELGFIEQVKYWLGVRDGIAAAYGLRYGDACNPPRPTAMHLAHIDGSLMAFAEKHFGPEEAKYIGLSIIALEWIREQRPGCYPGPRWR